MMSEEEKIFAGKMFCARKPELIAKKHKAHTACREFNAMDEYDPERQPLIQSIFGAVGKSCYFQGPLQINYGCHMFLGDGVFANFNFTAMDDARIYIGDRVCFGPNVSLMATNHPLIAQERNGLGDDGSVTFAEYAEEIHIGENTWVAANVVIIGGVTIGRNCVIGAGSVVTKDIPDNYLAYGVPCHPVREITERDSKRNLFLDEDREFFKNNLK